MSDYTDDFEVTVPDPRVTTDGTGGMLTVTGPFEFIPARISFDYLEPDEPAHAPFEIEAVVDEGDVAVPRNVWEMLNRGMIENEIIENREYDK